MPPPVGSKPITFLHLSALLSMLTWPSLKSSFLNRRLRKYFRWESLSGSSTNDPNSLFEPRASYSMVSEV